MADPAKDFRYTIGDKTIEGYQITEASRYQDKLWPEWLDSRDFISVDGQNCIKIAGEKLPLPDLSWIVRDATGHMSIVDALEFENYVKVVPLVAERFNEIPADIPSAGMTMPATDDGLLLDCKVVFGMLKIGSPEASQEALKHLTTMLSSRTKWCTCAPGQCQKLDVWGCREKSPLVGSDQPGQKQ